MGTEFSRFERGLNVLSGYVRFHREPDSIYKEKDNYNAYNYNYDNYSSYYNA